ncbi:hypothetical protein P8452_01634 [Trifolium repens]|nr:hypothetical protein P8452_01634 [Trifolium repens]
MENKSNSLAQSILHDSSFNDQVQKSSSSNGQYLGGYYFSAKKSMIPFKWEKEPGLPKEELGIPKKLLPSKIVPTPAEILFFILQKATMKNQSYSPAELIHHVDDDLFFSKVQESSSSIGQYSGCYYGDKQSVIPFKWEKEPGIPKELEPLPSNIVPPIIHTPTKKPKHVTKHVSTKSCFFVKPILLRSSKAKNDDEDKEDESFDATNHILRKEKFFSLHGDSKSFSGSSTASSKGTMLKFSRIASFANLKEVYKQFF